MYAKLSKRDYYKNKIQYLGHAISEERIPIDMEKVEAIMECHILGNVTNVISFMVTLFSCL